MNLTRIIIPVLCFALCSLSPVRAQEMDKELSDMATKLGALIKENGKKKVTVLDFADLQGGSSELGKYVAEQLTVNLVMVKKDFSVLDRANREKILAEHKLTATGLIDPENAKKLGQFAGVDALILGTIVSKGQKVSVTAKIITTDTAEIVGAAKAEFRSDETIQQLLSQPASEAASGDAVGNSPAQSSPKQSVKLAKTFGDLRVEIASLRIANGKDYFLSLIVTNLNPKRSIWIALNGDHGVLGTPLVSAITDPEGYDFKADEGNVRGIAVGEWSRLMGFYGNATEVKAKDSISATITFYTRPGRLAKQGTCRLQLAIALLAIDGYGQVSGMKDNNFVTEIKAE